MRFYVRDPLARKAAYLEFQDDCRRVRDGLRPSRVIETDIYITRRCNLRCSYCYFREYFNPPDRTPPPDPSLTDLRRLLDRIEGNTYCLVILGGEPFSREDFGEFLRDARRRDIYSLRVSTNGLYLRSKKEVLPLIDRLSVSFDCTRSAEYPQRMQQLLVDIVATQKELKERFPRLCLAWTTARHDDFQRDVRPLLDYAIAHNFEVKFLPVKFNQQVDWAAHQRIVEQAIQYAPPRTITNDLEHTRRLGSEFLLTSCLQGIQYYIDIKGQFLYPCDEFPDQVVGSVHEHTLAHLFDAGVQKYGVFPKRSSVCAQCPSGCHSDNSYIFRHPEAQMADLK